MLATNPKNHQERKQGESDSARLKKLSTPRAFHEEVKRNWELTPEMKNFKASKRLKEISQPVTRENVHINESPEKVSPSALKYKREYSSQDGVV